MDRGIRRKRPLAQALSGRFLLVLITGGMNNGHSKNNGKAATTREDRLKAALKANMAKRKAQTRARAADKNKKQKE